MSDSIWIWQVTIRPDDRAAIPDLTGYDVEAVDGHIGKVDAATYDNERGSLVVDTGFWIFGKKRMLPAGVVSAVEPEEHKLLVTCTKEQIKAAPDLDEARRDEESYRQGVASHYASLRGDPIAPTPGIEHQPNLR
jgi:hypothetical protein